MSAIPTGYKQSEIGVIPEEWDVDSVESVTPRGGKNGIVDGPFGSNLKTIHYRKSGIPIITSGYVTDGQFFAESYLYVDKEKFDQEKRSAVRPGDIVMAKIGARCGASAILPESHEIGILSGNALKITVDKSRHSAFYVWQVLWSLYSVGRIDELRTVGAQPAISMANLKKYKIPLPSLHEQRAIAAALSDVDALLAKLDKFIAKKRDLKQAAMQQLLTGQTRLPGFSGAWEVKRIADIASPSSERNMTGEKLPVLTCSKHLGFMDSLGFFKNQVFSKDLSTYKIIRRNEVGYPANHVEEGSIGLQDCYEVALVSPIYVVFRVNEGVNSFFLHRLLKLDSYRQRFKTATTSSVDRRGSLRWSAFSEITVELPPSEAEQTAIATILADMDAELAALEDRREKTRAIKQGMMQELLTGRIRLV